MSSMGEIRDEGEGQYFDWLLEHVSDAGLEFLQNAVDEGTISKEQADLLLQEAGAILNEDPYSSESFVSAWEKHPQVPKVYLVAAYHESRRYGGAEEGGWWYTHRDPLTLAYGEHHGRSFMLMGPYKDRNEAAEVMRDLTAFEGIGYPKGCESSIVWRVIDHAPISTPRAVYC